MNALRNGLCIGLLFISCVLGLQINFLLRQAGDALGEMTSSVSAGLWSATRTLDLARSTLAIQQGYYRDSASHVKSLTKAAAIDAVRLGRLIDTADTRLDRFASSVNGAVISGDAAAIATRDAAQELSRQTRLVGEAGTSLLQSGEDVTEELAELAGNRDIQNSLDNLETATRNLNNTTAESSEAMGYIRDMLSPRKKSFWKRLLYLMIPRPTITVP
jgi:hypothetical protein